MGRHESLEEGTEKRSLLVSVARFILHQWLLIGIGLACLLAYLFPRVASHGGIIRAEYTILYGAVIIIFLVSGLSIERRKLFRHILNWRLHILVQGMSFLVIPAIVYALVQLIEATDVRGRIDKSVLAGYILVACLPTTISSNVVMTRSAGGDDAAALVEVVVGNIIGPFVTPGWTVTLLPKSPQHDRWRDANNDLSAMYTNVFKELGLTVLLPLLVGQLIRWTWSEKTAWVLQKFYLAKIASSCLIFLIWSSLSTCFETRAINALTAETVIFIVLFNIVLYLFLTGVCFLLSHPPDAITPSPRHRFLSLIIRKLPPVETIAVCFCGAAKTTGLGIPMLYAMYDSNDLFMKAKLSVPVILYTTEQIFCAHFMVYFLRRWRENLEKKSQSDCESIVDCETAAVGGGESEGSRIEEQNERRPGLDA
ncbi:hypothetical protein AJ80_02192 [Polytolypa hystricis UAMH7299]|uniref:Sodium/bile acid cotransporter 7 n=1 Tax=Polytolypa hystricis (strain UAMH7299) TaxID=1447883 RepID=A0A2B7YSC0_POLH7|nr:hypothetical protein AJ80_02192 [Polytolypa hystricis UAMH7299]